MTKSEKPNDVFLILDKNSFLCQHNSVSTCYRILYSSPSADLLQLSGRKAVGACQREVSLVLSISSSVDKKTDGTVEVKGPCYGWRVCLFGLSLISCFPPSTACTDSAYSLTWKWPRWDGSRPLFTRRVNTNRPARHSGQLKTHGASVGFWPLSDKNNNWLIYTWIVELSADTVGGISIKTYVSDEMKVTEDGWKK